MGKRQSKKIGKITQLETYKKIRGVWVINPKTRRVPNKKKTRQQNKRDLEKENE